MKHLLLTTIAAVVLVGCKQSEADYALIDAAVENNLEGVKQLLAAGADVDTKVGGFIRGWTPLHFAARDGHKEVVEVLIAKGADVNAKDDEEGETPLHNAAYEGHKEIAELLIAAGANVSAISDGGITPLYIATELGNPKTAALLRKHGGKTGEELKAEGK